MCLQEPFSTIQLSQHPRTYLIAVANLIADIDSDNIYALVNSLDDVLLSVKMAKPYEHFGDNNKKLAEKLVEIGPLLNAKLMPRLLVLSLLYKYTTNDCVNYKIEILNYKRALSLLIECAPKDVFKVNK